MDRKRMKNYKHLLNACHLLEHAGSQRLLLGWLALCTLSLLFIKVSGSRYHCTHLTEKKNGSSEEFSNLPKATQLVKNLNLNSNPPRSLVRTKPQEQTIMQYPLRS